MKIAIVTSAQLPPQEGIGTYVYELSKRLRDEGQEVTILRRSGLSNRTQPELIPGVGLTNVPFIPVPPFHVDTHKVFLRFARERMRDPPDIVNFHSPLVPFVDFGVPSAVTVHSPMASGIKSMEHDSMQYVASRLVYGITSLRTERRALDEADGVMTTSNGVSCDLTRSPYNVPASKITVVGNAVDTDFYTQGDEARESGRVLWAGRITEGKGINDLISCAILIKKMNVRARFVVAGEGTKSSELRSLIRRYGLESNFDLLGWLDKDKLRTEYRKADVFLLTSHYEGLPTVVLEAMSCGTPVVATSVGGVSDVISDGCAGRLTPPGEPALLANAIAQLVTNPNLLSAMGRNARDYALSHFSWRSVGRDYLRALRIFAQGKMI